MHSQTLVFTRDSDSKLENGRERHIFYLDRFIKAERNPMMKGLKYYFFCKLLFLVKISLQIG